MGLTLMPLVVGLILVVDAQACTGKDELFIREVLNMPKGECNQNQHEAFLVVKPPIFDVRMDLSSCIDSSFGEIPDDPTTFGLGCSIKKDDHPEDELFQKIGCWIKGLTGSKFPNAINSIPDGSNEDFLLWLRSIPSDQTEDLVLPFKGVFISYIQILKLLNMPESGSFDYDLLQTLEATSLSTLRQSLPSLTTYMYLRTKALIEKNGLTPSIIEVEVPESTQLIYNLFGGFYVDLLKADDSVTDFACNLLGCSDNYFRTKSVKNYKFEELVGRVQSHPDTFRRHVESKVCMRIMSFFDTKDPITIDDILNLSPLEIEVLETSLTSMLTSLLDGTQSLGAEVEDELPRTHIDVHQTLCKARIDDMNSVLKSQDNHLQTWLDHLEPFVIQMLHKSNNCSLYPLQQSCDRHFPDGSCLQRLVIIEAFLRGNLMTLEPFHNSSMDVLRKIPYQKRKIILNFLENLNDSKRTKRSINGLESSARQRREASPQQPAESDPLTLEFYIIVAFHLYHRSVSIARERIENNQVTPEQNSTLDQIINSQRSGIFKKLTSFFNSPGPVTLLSSEVKFAVIVLSDGLTKKETASVDSEVLAFYLKVTKQIINILNLNPDDFSIGRDFPVPNMISKYLFGMDSNLISRSNVYLSSVNEIYENLRPILAKMSQTGGLSALQIIRAKSIINELSANSVAFLVKTLQIEDARMTPEEIMKTVVAKRENNEIDEDTEYFIKEKLYFLKLDALIKMIANLGMNRQELAYPESTPSDLLDLLFNTDLREISKVQQKHNPFNGNWKPPADSGDQVHDYGEGFFCMQCFHRMYEAWKRGQGINDGSQNVTSSLLRRRRGAVTTVDILDETLNDLVSNRTFLVFHTNSTIEGDDVFSDSPRYAPYITYLYIHVMEKALLEMSVNGSSTDEIKVFVKNQHRRVTEGLDQVLRQFPHTRIESPKGILLEATSDQAQRVVIDFVVRFYLDMITKVVETMRWTVDDLTVFYAMPKRLREIIFGNGL